MAGMVSHNNLPPPPPPRTSGLTCGIRRLNRNGKVHGLNRHCATTCMTVGGALNPSSKGYGFELAMSKLASTTIEVGG
jgi:hypothetical protein